MKFLHLKAVRFLGIAIAAALTAIIAVALLGHTKADVGPFSTTLTVKPSISGRTTVRLAPLGTIELDTHDAPIALELRVDELDLAAAERVAADPAVVERLGDDVADDIRDALWALIARAVLAAALGGAAGAAIASRRWRPALASGVAAAFLSASIAGFAAVTFDDNSIAQPRYTGILTVAPRAVGDVQDLVERFGQYRAQLAELVDNVAGLYQAAQRLPTGEKSDENTVAVLHVSDIHLNPQAFDLMDSLVRRFNIDVVADTGDITDWGTDAETAPFSRIGQLEVPYVWVRGNHDSLTVQNAVAAQPNAHVLDGQAETIAGLRFWGIGDPRYTPDKDQPVGKDIERDQAEAFASVVRRDLLRNQPPKVDVAMIHDGRSASLLDGSVALVLAGHTHVVKERRLGPSTIMLTEGSTGGAGLRGLQGNEPKPLTCSVLYFDRTTKLVVAYDRITVGGIGETGVTIERRIVAEPSSGKAPISRKG